MVNALSKQIRAFAIQRHMEYLHADDLSVSRVNAIVKILDKCQEYQYAQLNGWITQIKSSILAILPDEDGKFNLVRKQILDMLKTYNHEIRRPKTLPVEELCHAGKASGKGIQ